MTRGFHMPNDKISTPIVDKNGKATTVYRKSYTMPDKNRLRGIVAPVSTPVPTQFDSKDERRMNVLQEGIADIDHEWTRKYRVPMIHGMHPRVHLVATLAVPEKEIVTEYLEATEHEAALIGSYIQYKLSGYYSEHAIGGMRRHPVDVDEGGNTTSFAKLDRGWVYRNITWSNQPFYPYRDGKQYTNC